MSETFRVVGIGASAGGLEALKNLVTTLDANDPIVYVVAQHLSPTHASMMVELVARQSNLEVKEAIDGDKIVPGIIYITPPNKNIEIKTGYIILSAPEIDPGPKPNINKLFRSLANDQGAQAIGVVLSGTGSDGAMGLLEIKAAGGLTIVQDPNTCQYNGMPNSAISVGAVDIILPSHEIGSLLHSVSQINFKIADFSTADLEDEVSTLLDIIKINTNIDLRLYKRSTLERRLQRRMSLHQINSIENYIKLLQEDKKEIEAFIKDVFITVTSFFRDKDAFEQLKKVLLDLIQYKIKNRSWLRIWVAGCSTGEEAYTIAILLEEILQQAQEHIEYQIFATDISEQAIRIARSGTYELADLNPIEESLRNKYFLKQKETFQVIQALRDRIIFSIHNLIQDPPFSKIDLISCRNLLIYFNSTLQEQVLKTFNYSLNSNGYLFLGKSETVSNTHKLFKDFLEKEKIYQKFQQVSDYSHSSSRGITSYNISRPVATNTNKKEEVLAMKLYKQMAQKYAPPSILINENNQIIFVTKGVDDFVRLEEGLVRLDILEVIPEEMRATLRALIYKARRVGEKIIKGHCIINDKNTLSRTNICIELEQFHLYDSSWLILYFNKVNIAKTESVVIPSNNEEDSHVLSELENELTNTRESLQTVVEELETTNEELQASNEELQSTNEELQATNEELQTSNEELQSSNEELQTLNDEMQSRNQELEFTFNNLNNLQYSIKLPILVVSAEFRIHYFSSDLDQLAPLDKIRKDDPLLAIPWYYDMIDLVPLVSKSIQSESKLIQPIRFGDSYFQLKVSPYKTTKQIITGAVLTFFDTTDIQKTQTELQLEKDRIKTTLALIGDAIIRTDINGLIEYINPSAEDLLNISNQDVINQSLDRYLKIFSENDTQLPNLALLAIAKKTKLTNDKPVYLYQTDDKKITIEYVVTPLTNEQEEVLGSILVLHNFII